MSIYLKAVKKGSLKGHLENISKTHHIRVGFLQHIHNIRSTFPQKYNFNASNFLECWLQHQLYQK